VPIVLLAPPGDLRGIPGLLLALLGTLLAAGVITVLRRLRAA